MLLRFSFLIAWCGPLIFTSCQTSPVAGGGAYHVTAYKPHDPSKVVVKVSLSKENIYGWCLPKPVPMSRVTMLVTRWDSGVSSRRHMDFIRALSTRLRERMVAFVCMAKRRRNFMHWFVWARLSPSPRRNRKTLRLVPRCSGWMIRAHRTRIPTLWLVQQHFRNRVIRFS